MNRIVKEVAQWVAVALLAFGVFAWLEFKLVMPAMEKDIINHLPSDTIIHEIEVHVPVPHYIDSIVYKTKWDTVPPVYIWDTIRADIDTSAIIKDYFSRVNYADTVKNDSSALIVVNEVVHMNRIQQRNVLFKNNRKTAVIAPPDDNGLLLGVGALQDGVMVSVGYRLNKNSLSLSRVSNQWGLLYQYQID